MNTTVRYLGALALAFAAGCVVVFFWADLLGRVAAMPFEREKLLAWGGHRGLFGLLLSLAALVPSSIAAFVLSSLVFHFSGRANVHMVLALSLPWLLLCADAFVPHIVRANGFTAAQILIAIACVPLAIYVAAQLKRRANVP